MNIIRRIATVIGSTILAVALVPGIAHAAAPKPLPMYVEAVTRVVQTTVTAADLAPVMHTATTARPGEGVIRITTRICGNANNWQNVAASNGIKPPVYLVLLGQQLTVACVGTSAPTPSQQSAPAPVAAASGWVAPVRACINSGFGWRQWSNSFHQGVDMDAGYGVAIQAASGGTVSRAGWIWSGYGISVTINHGVASTHYAHLSRWIVSPGQWVSAGQVVGYVGSTGFSTGPHLHFEVATGTGILGSQINPVSFMAARGVRLGC